MKRRTPLVTSTGTARKRRAPIPFRLIGIALGAAVVMFMIGYLIAVRVLFPPLPAPKNGIVVPRLTGLSVGNAEAELNEIGLRVSEVIELPHPSEPAGVIIAQSPLPGQQLRIAGAVRLGVSSGPPQVEPIPVVAPTSPTVPDTLKATPDTSQVPPDTLRVPPDTLRPPADTLH